MNSVGARFFRGMGAASFGQMVTAVTQLASLPIFLICWNVQTYGSWVLMMALPAPFALADFGMNTVAGTRMNILIVQGKLAEARSVFHSALMFTCATVGICGLLGIAGVELVPNAFLSQAGVRDSLFFILLDTLLVVFSGLFEASFRANGQFALGIFLLNWGRVFEWCGSISGALLFRTLPAAAAGLFLGRLIATFCLLAVTRRRFPHLSWRFKDSSFAELKLMLAPALAYMGVQAGSFFSLQGLTIVVAQIGGPVEVAIFSAYRTLARLLVQFTALIGRPLLPEVSRYLAQDNLSRVSQLYIYAMTGTVALVALLATAQYSFGQLIIQYWAHGSMPFRAGEFSALLVYGVLCASWQISLAVLTGLNRHLGFAAAYVSISFCGLISAYLAGRTFGISGILGCLILSEAGITLAATYNCRYIWVGRSTPLRPRNIDH